MNKILNDFIANLKIFRRSRGTIFWTIAFPFLLILLFGAIFSVQNPKFDLYIQNQDYYPSGSSTNISNAFIQALNSTNAFNMHLVDRQENATKIIQDQKLSFFITIPLEFEQNYTIGNNTTIIIQYDQSKSSSLQILGIVNGVINSFNLQRANGSNIIKPQMETLVSSTFNYMDFFAPGVLGMTIMTTGIMGTVFINTKYRNNGVLKKLATTPITRLEWILAKVLYQIVIAFISMALILGAGIYIYNMKIIPNILSIIIVISGSLTFTGLGMIIARFVKEEESADAAASAITFPMMFLAGTFFPLEMMPEVLRVISKVLPLTYVNDGLRAAMITGDVQAALINTGIVLGLGLFFIIIGALITRWKEE